MKSFTQSVTTESLPRGDKERHRPNVASCRLASDVTTGTMYPFALGRYRRERLSGQWVNLSQERTRVTDPVGLWEPKQRCSFLSDFQIEDVKVLAHSGG